MRLKKRNYCSLQTFHLKPQILHRTFNFESLMYKLITNFVQANETAVCLICV
jgi:hypothetical protein